MGKSYFFFILVTGLLLLFGFVNFIPHDNKMFHFVTLGFDLYLGPVCDFVVYYL